MSRRRAEAAGGDRRYNLAVPPAFQLFGPDHLAAMATVAIAAAGAVAVARTWPALRRGLRVGLAVVLVVATAAHLAGEAARGELSVWAFVPLHLCDFALFVAVFALLTGRQLACELLYFWALAGTTLAIVTPDLPEGFPSPRFAFYFALHGGVIIAAVLLVWGAGRVPRPGAPWRALVWLNVYAAFVALVNAVTGANFLYLRAKPAGDTLLDHFGPWPVYLLVAEVVALVLFYLLDLPFRRQRAGVAPAASRSPAPTRS